MTLTRIFTRAAEVAANTFKAVQAPRLPFFVAAHIHEDSAAKSPFGATRFYVTFEDYTGCEYTASLIVTLDAFGSFYEWVRFHDNEVAAHFPQGMEAAEEAAIACIGRARLDELQHLGGNFELSELRETIRNGVHYKRPAAVHVENGLATVIGSTECFVLRDGRTFVVAPSACKKDSTDFYCFDLPTSECPRSSCTLANDELESLPCPLTAAAFDMGERLSAHERRTLETLWRESIDHDFAFNGAISI